MGLFDRLRKRKVEIKREPTKELYIMPQDKVEEFLSTEIKEFFPQTGEWSSTCFKDRDCLQCRLRDNAWLSTALFKKLTDKGIYIAQSTIKRFMDNSAEFAELRHNYELEIVKWQIKWMANGGENWLIPDGYSDESIIYSPTADDMFRKGVIKTLRAINLDKEVIEEGIEKFARLWRDAFMLRCFEQTYEKIIYLFGYSGPADEEHKQNWLKLRRYKYYQAHKTSVDKYGEVLPEMKMTPEQAHELAAIVTRQNNERLQYLKAWEEGLKNYPTSAKQNDI